MRTLTGEEKSIDIAPGIDEKPVFLL